ncbi:MAG: hypothetical protein KAG56_04520 [Sulfurovaceae bacterium]|nr:hypothetical protein [Sulfurovaceae bacterium]
MDSRLLYMYILMIITLLIGFFIGWILRRSSYQEQYENKIYDLQYAEEEKFEKLKSVEVDFENIQNLHLDNKDSFRIKSERLDSYIEQDKQLKREIDEIKRANALFKNNIPVVDDEINEALSDLEKVKNARNLFLEQIDEVNSYDHDIRGLNNDIEHMERLIPSALDKKNELSKSIKTIKERLEQQEKKFDESDLEIVKAQKEYVVKKSSVELELKESALKEEKYQEILIKIEDKIVNGEELSRSDFKDFLDEQNAHSSGWFNTIYKKSKNLFKGEQ